MQKVLDCYAIEELYMILKQTFLQVLRLATEGGKDMTREEKAEIAT